MRQYVTYKPELYTANQKLFMKTFCVQYGLEGTEVFMDDVVPRDAALFGNAEEKETLIAELGNVQVKRIHCSYWAYPTSFLTGNRFGELVERFGGLQAVAGYYGDLTGAHMFSRWVQEYELACALHAQAYTFHLIDYAPIDGEWRFTIPREQIAQAMVFMIQGLLCRLQEKGLLGADSPTIELENAGWGLEYGSQTCEDFRILFEQLYDTHDKVRIGWDLNHLLHAIGHIPGEKNARFLLPDWEINAEMRVLETQYGHDDGLFAVRWLEYNILNDAVAGKAGSLHVSDCGLNSVAYFVEGKLASPYAEEMAQLQSWEEKENYGVEIVLSKYDCHIPLGTGVLPQDGLRVLIAKLTERSPQLVLLHELKNSKPLEKPLRAQLAFLRGE